MFGVSAIWIRRPQFVLPSHCLLCRFWSANLLNVLIARVLDEKLRRETKEKVHPTPGSSRKRARQSGI